VEDIEENCDDIITCSEHPFLALRWLLLLAISLLISLRSLGFDYTLDDFPHLDQAQLNTQIPELLLTEGTWPGNLFRPFFSLSLMGGLAVHGDNAAGFHFLNCILYALTVLSCYFLGRKLLGESTAFIGALIFSVLPIHSEVVGSIAFRTELLSALFVTVGLNLLLSTNQGTVRTLIAIASVLLALLSKESSLTVVPLYLLSVHHLGWSFSDIRKGLLAISIPVVVYFGMRYYAVGQFLSGPGNINYLDNPLVSIDFLPRATASLALLGKYVAQIVAPHDLSIDYSHAKLSAFYPAGGMIHMSLEAKFYLLTLLSLIFVGVVNRNHSSRVGVLWFLFAFSITCNIIKPIGTIFADRLAFLPSLGICWVLAGAIVKVARSRARLAVCALIILTYSSRFYVELDKWEDSVAIAVSEIKSSPQSAKVNYAYGKVLSKAGKFDDAEKHFLKALRIYPEYSSVWATMGKMHQQKGEPDLAKKFFKRALAVNKGDRTALVELGKIYLNEKKPDLAGVMFTSALSKNNYDESAIVGLIHVLTAKGKTKQAARFQKELKRIRGQKL